MLSVENIIKENKAKNEISNIGKPSAAPSDISNVEEAYAKLRDAILRLRIAPGSVVSQVKIAKTYGISRTPLREAIRMLQREGLVVSQHNKRIRVAEASIEDMEELYANRITLEAYAVHVSVPKLTGEDILTLNALLEEMDKQMRVGDVDTWETPHREFHQILTAYAGKRTNNMLRDLSDHAERYRRLFISQGTDGWKQSATEHKAIFACCQERDGSGAALVLAKHLARTSLGIFLNAAPEHEPAKIRTALRIILGNEAK